MFLAAIINSLGLPLLIDILFTIIKLVVKFRWILILPEESPPNFTKIIITTALTLILQTILIYNTPNLY